MKPAVQVSEAYRRAFWLYRFFWGGGHSFHYGYWNENTRTLKQALQQFRVYLAEKADIRPEQVVLDLGCGTGGLAVFLAKHYQCRVTGLDLGRKNLERAQKYSRQQGQIVAWVPGDYHQLPFPDQYFDQIWAIETFFHSPNLTLALQEAARCLKPGGRLLVADYLASAPIETPEDVQLLQRWCHGYHMPRLRSLQHVEQALHRADLQLIGFTDISTHVAPSVARLYHLAQGAYQLGRLFHGYFPLFTSLSALVAQYQLFRKKQWQYAVYSAQKPT
jgi:ubiquinone/menaquinone biosynthesis C-methylase UbiE